MVHKQHFAAFMRAVRSEPDAPAFLVGYLLQDIPDRLLCDALAAFERHKKELAELEKVDDEETAEESMARE